MKFWASMAFSPIDHYVPLARAAEEAGVYGILLSDHIFYPQKLDSPYPYSPDGMPIWDPSTPWPDVWVTTGAMVSATSRLHFGQSIYIAPARDVMTVGKAVGTAAALSGNRIHLGLGAGWMKEEFDQTGQSFTNRGKRLDEMIQALRALWGGGWVEYHGKYYDFGPLQMEPAPSQTVPIWCGGHTVPAMRRAARYCDGWVGNAYPEDEAARRIADLKTHLAEAGREGEEFEIIVGLYAPPTLEVVKRAADLGVTGLLCMPWALEARDDDHDVAGIQGRTAIEKKIEATRRFGEQFVGPAAGI